MPLQKWFLAIGLVVNAKKSVSSCQLSRDLDLNQKTAWYMQQRIRAAMANTEGDLLQGIVEADETYVGGKPRKGNRRDEDTPSKRGRGTKKTPVVGAVERHGRVVARVAEDLFGKGLLRFLRSTVQPKGTLLITDEFPGYHAADGIFRRAVVNHKREYAFGHTHTNSIESFWSLVKRAWYGNHHQYSRKFMPLFIAESCWKYNARRDQDAFGSFLRGCFA